MMQKIAQMANDLPHLSRQLIGLRTGQDHGAQAWRRGIKEHTQGPKPANNVSRCKHGIRLQRGLASPLGLALARFFNDTGEKKRLPESHVFVEITHMRNLLR